MSKISETVGSQPLKVYREIDGQKIESRDHRAWRMLHDQPNESVPAHRFWSTVTGNVLLWGNAFLLKARDDTGLVNSLSRLDPSRMEIEYSEVSGQKRYTYTRQNSERVAYSEEQIIHIMDFSLDGIVGQSRISRCRDGIGKALARDRYEATFYGRGATLRGVIEHPQRLNDTVKLRESWTAVYGGARNAHQVAVLEEGAQFKPLSMSMEDMQFIQSAQLSLTDIAILFNLPPAHLGGSAAPLTYQTVESNGIWYATQTIAPVTHNISKTIERDRGVFPFPSWWPEFDLKALMRGDAKSRADFYKSMTEVNAILPSEIRSLEGLPPIEGIDDPPEPPPMPVAPVADSQNGNGVPEPVEV